MAQKRILVTGGFGLIGHNVVRQLQQQGHHVAIVDNKTNYGIVPADEMKYLFDEREARMAADTPLYLTDIQDMESMQVTFNREQPDVIIHLASFPRQKVVNAHPVMASSTMMSGMMTLLELACKHQVQRFIYASSSMVYGAFQDDVTEDHECRPQGQYGIMKLAGEWLLRDYSRRGSFEHVILRPSAVYGPLDVRDRVISQFMLAARRDETLRVRGAQECLDFTFVDDAAMGIVAAVTAPAAANNTYNITRSHSWSLLEAAELACKIAGRGRIEVEDRDPDFPSRGSLNIDQARRDLGFDPKIDVEQGFRIYNEWFENSVFWNPQTV